MGLHLRRRRKEASMRIRLLTALLLLLSASAALADDVYLTNGRKFEGVIAEVIDSQVRIQMSGGVLSLPRGQVLRVEKADSVLGDFLARRAALKRGARAEDWLDLARWAKARGLDHDAREAALVAAGLDPHLAGLGPLLRGWGFVFDVQLDRWIPYGDSMRRRGFVFADGQWITREEYAEKARAREEEAARRRFERDAARVAQAARAALEAEQARAELELYRASLQPASPAGIPIYPYYGVPVVAFPGFVFPQHPKGHQKAPAILAPGPDRSSGREAEKDDASTFLHVPGSLIPGRLGPGLPPISSHR
jgi:hypothetical protein